MSFVSARMDADPRKHLRHYVNLRSRLVRPGEELVVWTVDLSGGGARVAVDSAAAGKIHGDGWSLVVPGVGAFPATKIWHRGPTHGLRFDIAKEERAQLAAELAKMFPVRY